MFDSHRAGRFVFVMDLHSTLVRYPSTGLQEEKAGSDGPPLNIRGECCSVSALISSESAVGVSASLSPQVCCCTC